MQHDIEWSDPENGHALLFSNNFAKLMANLRKILVIRFDPYDHEAQQAKKNN